MSDYNLAMRVGNGCVSFVAETTCTGLDLFGLPCPRTNLSGGGQQVIG